VRNRLKHQRPALRRLAQALTLTALAGGVLPTTAAIAEGTTAAQTAQTAQTQPAAAAGWSLVATLDSKVRPALKLTQCATPALLLAVATASPAHACTWSQGVLLDAARLAQRG
jgi:hypothetical protein